MIKHKFAAGDRVRVTYKRSTESGDRDGQVVKIKRAGDSAWAQGLGETPFYSISESGGGVWEDELTLVMSANAPAEDQVTEEEIAAFKRAWNSAGPGGRVRAGLAAVKRLSL